MSRLEEFYKFAYKRQLIWYKRFIKKEEAPWSTEEIFNKQRFLNVYRELDKGTLYFLDRFKNLPRKSLLKNIVFYKFFNKVGTYENAKITTSDINNLDKPEVLDKVKKSFDELLKQGTIFNDAYLVTSGKGVKHYKLLSIISSFDFDNLIKLLDEAQSPEESYKLISTIPHVGSFIAYEIWTSLTYFNFFKQKYTEDDFVNIGPGAEPTIHYIFGEKSKGKELEYFEELYNSQTLLKDIHKKLNEPVSWEKIRYKESIFKGKLSRLTIENICCEFRKYIAHTTGKTSAKTRGFNPNQVNDYLKDRKFEDRVMLISKNIKKLESSSEDRFDFIAKYIIETRLNNEALNTIEKDLSFFKRLFSLTGKVGNLIIHAVKKDKEFIEKANITQSEIVEFLLQLDSLTLGLISTPIKFIEASTGYKILNKIKFVIKSSEEKVLDFIRDLEKLKLKLSDLANNISDTDIKLSISNKIEDIKSTILEFPKQISKESENNMNKAVKVKKVLEGLLDYTVVGGLPYKILNMERKPVFSVEQEGRGSSNFRIEDMMNSKIIKVNKLFNMISTLKKLGNNIGLSEDDMTIIDKDGEVISTLAEFSNRYHSETY